MQAPPVSCLYDGRVMHQRLRPFRQRFTYRVWSVFVDLAEWDGLRRRLRALGIERRGPASLRAADHGPRDGSPLLPWVRHELAARGIEDGGGRVFMLAFPRVLGYVFNPLTVYYAYDSADRLRALLYEVKNTFGGQHLYAFAVDGTAPRHAHGCDKDFYVSPFIPMQAAYAFNVTTPGERLSVVINERVAEGPQLVASLTGVRRPLDDRNVAACLLRQGPMTLKVIAGIHWQALKLWWRGAPFRGPSSVPQPVVAGNSERRREPR
ncbi:MAG: DUF1365 domain-containing protein [Geminicoccaceae bacterium]|nr:MAG: DUF1365 domain-containing protein [Geminicoccaceae bacterium]